jgi:PqqD family protein of HPr-rel-A system
MTEPVWHAPAPGRLLLTLLDTLTAAYDRESGQTHLLAPPLPEILQMLSQAPASSATLIARMRAMYRIDLEDAGTAGAAAGQEVDAASAMPPGPSSASGVAPADVAAIILQRLAELEALGLIEARR